MVEKIREDSPSQLPRDKGKKEKEVRPNRGVKLGAAKGARMNGFQRSD